MKRIVGVSVLVAMAGCAGGIRRGENENNLLTKVATGNFKLVGVTDDNFAIVTDTKSNTTSAVNLGTGATQTIVTTPLAQQLDQWIVGTTVVLYHNANATATTASLTAWTAAGGAKLLSSNAVMNVDNKDFILRVSRDGQRAAWWEHVDAATDALVTDNPTGTGHQLLMKVSNACSGRINVPNKSVVAASYCTVAPTGGTSDHVVTAFNLASSTTVALQPTNARLAFHVDPTGARAVVRAGDGTATIVSLDGTVREPMDVNVGNVNWLPDGSEAYYVTADGAIKRICHGGLPFTLLSSGAAGLLGASWDGTSIAYYARQDATTGNYDIRMLSTTTNGAPLVLDADGEGAMEAFSGDSLHAMFYEAVDATGHGTFATMPVSGGPGRVLSTGQSAVNGDWELKGWSKVVFNDRWVAATATVPEHVALEVVDFATTNPPRQLVASADAVFAVTADRSTLVYTSNDPATPGLYTIAIP